MGNPVYPEMSKTDFCYIQNASSLKSAKHYITVILLIQNLKLVNVLNGYMCFCAGPFTLCLFRSEALAVFWFKDTLSVDVLMSDESVMNQVNACMLKCSQLQ